MEATSIRRSQVDTQLSKDDPGRKLHLIFNDAIKEVRNQIEVLQELVEEVEGFNDMNKNPKPESVMIEQSLSEFLNMGPQYMVEIRENLMELISRLRQALYQPKNNR